MSKKYLGIAVRLAAAAVMGASMTAALAPAASATDWAVSAQSASVAERLAAIKAAATEAQGDAFFNEAEPFSNTHVDNYSNTVS